MGDNLFLRSFILEIVISDIKRLEKTTMHYAELSILRGTFN